MSKKAVYSNKGLQVYITQEDFEELLEGGFFTVPVLIGKNETEMGKLSIDLSLPAHSCLVLALNAEQAAIDEARNTASRGLKNALQTMDEDNRS